jgi:predicted chitinase
LASDHNGFYGAAWYRAVARPHINSLSDADDLIGVTKATNGGLHGIQDRRNFWTKNKALSANGEWS